MVVEGRIIENVGVIKMMTNVSVSDQTKKSLLLLAGACALGALAVWARTQQLRHKATSNE